MSSQKSIVYMLDALILQDLHDSILAYGSVTTPLWFASLYLCLGLYLVRDSVWGLNICPSLSMPGHLSDAFFSISEKDTSSFTYFDSGFNGRYLLTYEISLADSYS